MNLSTNTLISSSFPSKNPSILNRGYTENSKNREYFLINLNSELPVYLFDKYSIFKYNYGTNRFTFTNLPYNVNVVKNVVAIKVLSKNFYSAFSNYARLKKYLNKEGSYYVAKGIITDSNLNPYIMTTYTLGNDDLDTCNITAANSIYPSSTPDDIPLNIKKLKIYISRKVFSKEFADNHKRMYKEIHSVILPEITSYNVPVIIKEELNMAKTIYIDPKLKMDDYKQKFINDFADVKDSIIRGLL